MATLSNHDTRRHTIRTGLIAGLVVLSVSAIGMVQTFNSRDIVTGVLTLGQLLLFGAPLAAGFIVMRHSAGQKALVGLLASLVAGILAALPVSALVLIAVNVDNIRSKLVNVSAALIETLTFGQGTTTGLLLLIGTMALLGLIGGVIEVLPARFRRPLMLGLLWTVTIGLLSELLLGIFRNLLQENAASVTRPLFGTKGLRTTPAAVFFVILTALAFIWNGGLGDAVKKRYSRRRNPAQARGFRLGTIIVFFIILLILPSILGRYLTQVLDNVGLYILMGLGLNIVVGFAGLLDLGYVAFYAIGAYTMGILTSTGQLGIAQFSFWEALPISIAASVFAGILLGTPVLRMRGDYLAIVTLGFGEIIRVLATSDLLKPYIGGAQGILNIVKPAVPDAAVAGGRLIQPEHFYYLIVGAGLLAAFVSWRLRDSRLGRQWMALREDEDVAEAMGIHLVKTKLLAFAMGAAFSGLAGAIFAAQIGSIYPHSFNLIISINVLSLIIVGGIGSLPGVVVGALVLVGLPELLREFAEYRYLMYGALL
ncbi:MAG: branched-chain amino acid ABC transporter permease, partial [Anaerolineae bacterium]|nr:branched-chain amino acid ABC transporter permease [Anaerolineae bacterium]